MSNHYQGAVWRSAPYSDTTFVVLLAMADCANDHGILWYSVPKLAKKSRLSQRAFRERIVVIEQAGFLNRTPRPGRSNIWRLTFPDAWFGPPETDTPDADTPDASAPPADEVSTPAASRRTTPAASRSHLPHSDPSGDPSGDPSPRDARLSSLTDEELDRRMAEARARAIAAGSAAYARVAGKGGAR